MFYAFLAIFFTISTVYFVIFRKFFSWSIEDKMERKTTVVKLTCGYIAFILLLALYLIQYTMK